MYYGFGALDAALLVVLIVVLKKLIGVIGINDGRSHHYHGNPMKIVTPIIERPSLWSRAKDYVSNKAKSRKVDSFAPLVAKVAQPNMVNIEPKILLKIISSSYSSLVEALNEGNIFKIKDLCSEDVYVKLGAYLNNNFSRGFVTQQLLFDYDSVDIVALREADGFQDITISLKTRMGKAIYDKEGELLTGDAHSPSIIEDEVVMRRKLPSGKWMIHDIGSALISNEIR
jgi:predicted lipid-binding transport protein (Tim44 family)